MRFSDISVYDFAQVLMRSTPLSDSHYVLRINGIPMGFFKSERQARIVETILRKKDILAVYEIKALGRKAK